MQRSKSLAMAFVLGALLVGGVLGFTADRVFAREEPCAKKFTREAMRQRLGDELDMSGPQRAALDSILDRRRTSIDALLAPVRPAMKAVSDSSEARIIAILDARQRAKFAEMRASHEQSEKDSKTRRDRDE